MRLSDQSRGCIRSILVTIIIGTIPFYILGIIVWLVPGGTTPDQPAVTQPGDTGDDGDSGTRPTWTPINPDELVTLRPVTGTVTLVTAAPTGEIITPAPTILVPSSTPTREFIPIVPTVPSATPTPTLTRTPTAPPTLTNTVPPQPTLTDTPTITQPPLLPPTDTPAP